MTMQDIPLQTDTMKNPEDIGRLQRLVSIVEATDDAVFGLDRRCIIESWNPGAEKLYGFSRGEAIGRHVSILWPSGGEEEGKELIDRIMRGEHVRNYRTVRLRKDATPVPVSVTATPVVDAAGAVTGAAVIARDMTDWIAMERKISESERLALSMAEKRRAEEALLRSERGLALLKDVASAANAAATTTDVFSVAVAGIARYLDWPVGHVYAVEEGDPDTLRPTTVWYFADEERFRPFRELTERTVIRRGRGLIGQILERGELVWFDDVATNAVFLRKNFAQDLAVHGAFGFPIVVDDRIEAVLEFFSQRIEPPDPAVIALMNEIAFQIGIVVARKKEENELRTLHRAVEQSPATVVITDVHGTIQYVNPKFTRTTGYSAEEAIGENPRIINSHTQPPAFYREMWETILAGKEWSGQFCNRKKSGEIYWEWASISPVRGKSGEITHFVAVKEDITRMLQYEEELRMAKEAAEEANHAKSEFLAAMSHELRTPLNAVIGFSEVLKERYFGPLTEKQEEYVNDILESGRHLLSLINDILDISKIEAGRMELELSEVDVEGLIRQSFVMIREMATRHTIEVRSVIDPDVGKTPIAADERKLKQVFYNLLSNAVKFTPDGGLIELRAGIDAGDGKMPGRFLRISVRDTGEGISRENLNRIFDKFFQVGPERIGKPAGTGLGLPLSREFVALHGGMIWAESDGEGKGSTFVLKIPVDRGSDGLNDDPVGRMK